MNPAVKFLSREKVIFGFYLAVSIIIGYVIYFRHRRFNNLAIFRQSFFHFLEHKNLYIGYPSEYKDIFLYHPSFPLLFSPFSLMPVPVAVMLWSVCCALIIYYAISALPITEKEKVFFWWFVLIEVATTLNSQQTNSIIAAMGLLTFAFLEKGKGKWAALFPVLAFCIKGYGLIFAALFIFYPKPGKYILYSALWLVILTLLPLPFVGTEYFTQLYTDWLHCLTSDHSANFGFSIMGMIQLKYTFFNDHDVTAVQLAGLALFGITWLWNLVKGNFRSKNHRLLLLAYCSLWVIIFNHASEAPTIIIAAQGIALFYLVNRHHGKLYPKALAALFIFLSIVAHKDIYPASWPFGFIPSLVAKTLPCVLVWMVLQVQLFLKTKEPNTSLPEKELSSL